MTFFPLFFCFLFFFFLQQPPLDTPHHLHIIKFAGSRRSQRTQAEMQLLDLPAPFISVSFSTICRTSCCTRGHESSRWLIRGSPQRPSVIRPCRPAVPLRRSNFMDTHTHAHIAGGKTAFNTKAQEQGVCYHV